MTLSSSGLFLVDCLVLATYPGYIPYLLIVVHLCWLPTVVIVGACEMTLISVDFLVLLLIESLASKKCRSS